jgi:hypothetical protein
VLYALCDRSSRSARLPGCARVDSRLDTAKIGSDGRVEAHRARLRAVFGRQKAFPHGLDPYRKSRSFNSKSCTRQVWVYRHGRDRFYSSVRLTLWD